jgi:hypothetical protein
VTAGHWRDRSGEEVDLVLERTDGSVVGIEVKAASRVRPMDTLGLSSLAKRVGQSWLGGVVLYTGVHHAVLDQRANIAALPIDVLWQGA